MAARCDRRVWDGFLRLSRLATEYYNRCVQGHSEPLSGLPASAARHIREQVAQALRGLGTPRLRHFEFRSALVFPAAEIEWLRRIRHGGMRFLTPGVAGGCVEFSRLLLIPPEERARVQEVSLVPHPRPGRVDLVFFIDRSGQSLLQRMAEGENMRQAWGEVRANGGCRGVDGQSLEDFERRLNTHLQWLSQSLLEASYHPTELLRIYIPKPDGSLRPLSIPTVKDRVVQAAMLRVWSPLWESLFQDCSFGFRPGRGCGDALERLALHLKEGRRWIVDVDIKSYYDTVHRPSLLKMVHDGPGGNDARLMELVRRTLEVKVQDLEGRPVEEAPGIGIPQGGPASPFFANIYLNGLDARFMETRFALVRYADDMVVACRKQEDAFRAFELLEQGLAELKLRLNMEKTRIVDAHDTEFNFLGYTFSGPRRFPSRKAVERFKGRLTELAGLRMTDRRIQYRELRDEVIRGWRGYYAQADDVNVFKELESWMAEHAEA